MESASLIFSICALIISGYSYGAGKRMRRILQQQERLIERLEQRLRPR